MNLHNRDELSEDRLDIFVQHNQLHIRGRMTKSELPFTNLYNTIQVAELQENVFKLFNNGEYNNDQATHQL